MKRKEVYKNFEKGGIVAKKSLGQNFLNSDGALDAVVKAGRVTKKDVVLEIGPGKGALTKRLLKTGATVIAVEKDDRLISVLKELFAKEIKSKQLTLVHDDVLKLNVRDYVLCNTDYKLIANIPYYITGEITRKFLSGDLQPSLMVILVQKEVAERIISKDKKESILSISVKVYGEPKYIQTVKAGCFFPPPKVDSAILLIDNISKDNFINPQKIQINLDPREYTRMTVWKNDTEENEQRFFEFVKTGFAHKRKTLSNNLKKLIAKEKLIELRINENDRAENLSLAQWLEMTSA